MDRISNLPDEIVDLILERLSLIDKVRTGALSRIWRFRWTRHPSLIMDEEFWHSVHLAESVPDENAHLERARVTKKVGLQQHSGSLRELSLYVPDGDGMCETSLSLYQDVICSVVNNSSSSTLERLILTGANEEQGLLLPPSIFSLVNLRQLEIPSIQFQPPSRFEGFPNLTLFSLVSELVSNHTISQFVAVCPQLKTVCLEYLIHQDGNVDLMAPQLCHLQLTGYFNDILVSNAENLDSISLISEYREREEEGISADMFRFLISSTQLKHMSLNGFFCEILGCCSVIHKLPEYGLMRSLDLQNVILDQADQLQSVLCLLAACPKLRNLELGLLLVPSNMEEPVEVYKSMTDYINADLEYLTRVELSGIVGTKVQMKVIELLLCFSPVLETMHIKLRARAELKLQEVEHLSRSSFNSFNSCICC